MYKAQRMKTKKGKIWDGSMEAKGKIMSRIKDILVFLFVHICVLYLSVF